MNYEEGSKCPEDHEKPRTYSELVRNFERKEHKLTTMSVELSSLKSQVEELLLTNAVMSMFHSQSFNVPLLDKVEVMK